VTVATAASLTIMAARHAPQDEAAATLERAEQLRARAIELADEDVAAYTEVLRAERTDDRPRRRRALQAATDVPLEIVRCAREVALLAAPLATGGKARLQGDAGVAVALAEAAARGAAALVVDNTRAGDLDGSAMETAVAWGREATAALETTRVATAGR
jgi:formiminotetrahydrofolate cyclodeaminase